MPRSDRDIVTVSPPTLAHTDFSAIDCGFSETQAAYDRDWISDRFADGLQIRMFQGAARGYVMFQPGRLSWRPIEGADRAIVIHDLRVADAPGADETTRRLWDSVESFARYYGYAAVLAIGGEGCGVIPRLRRPTHRWLKLDQSACGSELWGRILQGPLALPRFPDDFAQRVQRLGPGLCVQTTGEMADTDRRIAALRAAMGPEPVAIDRLADARAVHQRAVRPGAGYSVVLDGRVLGGADLDEADVLRALRTARRR